MLFSLLFCGKTTDENVRDIINQYSGRLSHYCNFEIIELPAIKNTKSLSEAQQKEKEAAMILGAVNDGDFLVLLDVAAKQQTSEEFAERLQNYMLRGIKRVVFAVGGPYGFDASVYARCNEKISLSKMTFSHQIVRVIFAEQLYRAFTIIKGEPYHHG